MNDPEPAPAASASTGLRWWLGRHTALIGVTLAALTLLGFGNNLDRPTLQSIVNEASLTAILVLGAMLLYYGGDFDFTIGSVFALCLVCVGLGTSHWDFAVGVVLALAVACAAGMVNGILAHKLRLGLLLSFVVAVVWRELAMWIGGGKVGALLADPHAVRLWGQVLGIPLPAWLAAAAYLMLHVIGHKTVILDRIFALGFLPQARAIDLDFNAKWLRLLLYVLSALFAGCAAVFYFARLQTMDINDGYSLPLESLAALVIGNQGQPCHRARPLSVLAAVVALTMLKFGIEGMPNFPVPYIAVTATLVVITLWHGKPSRRAEQGW